jgi:hypothetical protein
MLLGVRRDTDRDVLMMLGMAGLSVPPRSRLLQFPRHSIRPESDPCEGQIRFPSRLRTHFGRELYVPYREPG